MSRDAFLQKFLQELAAHRDARQQRLRAPDGWLSLVARYVLDEGDNNIDGGVASMYDGEVRLHMADGSTHVWPKEAPGPGPFFFAGQKRYELLRQGGRSAVRIRDPNSLARAAFDGLDFYLPDPSYCVRAQLDESKKKIIALGTGIGGSVDHVCPGTLHFELQGKACTLDPVIEDDAPDKLFLLFCDPTNRDETYGAGRFLYAALPDADGFVVVDFNKAYNPPCALTEFASCPVAPPQNRLSMRIEAGEKKPR